MLVCFFCVCIMRNPHVYTNSLSIPAVKKKIIVCKQCFSIQKEAIQKQHHITSSRWLEFVTINIEEVESPLILLHESFGHVVIISGVQARFGQCFTNTHVGFLHHCVALPWVKKHGFLPKVVQVVQCCWSVPYVETFLIRLFGNQGPHQKDFVYSLGKSICWLLWQKKVMSM